MTEKYLNNVEYGEITKLMKSCNTSELTNVEGVKNYVLKPVYAPVLDRIHIDKFNPKATCISLCGNEKFTLKDENKFINDVIKIIECIKWYYLNNSHGLSEHIFEYSLFEHFGGIAETNNLKLENLMLYEYTIDINHKGEYYVILWFTPDYYAYTNRKHLYWHEAKSDCEWY